MRETEMNAILIKEKYYKKKYILFIIIGFSARWKITQRFERSISHLKKMKSLTHSLSLSLMRKKKKKKKKKKQQG